ncbi:MAG: hypothetical protein ACRYFS_01085, partial [Janthinobacterium lividum]
MLLLNKQYKISAFSARPSATNASRGSTRIQTAARACYALCRLVWSDLPLARLNLEYFGQQPALFG